MESQKSQNIKSTCKVLATENKIVNMQKAFGFVKVEITGQTQLTAKSLIWKGLTLFPFDFNLAFTDEETIQMYYAYFFD